MKVVLINPLFTTEAEKHWAGRVSLGLGYLAASLLEKGIKVSILDGRLENYSLDELVLHTLSIKPDLIGITCMTIDFPITKQLSKSFKQHGNTPIIIGGAHCNALKELTLKECRDIDYCCYGEGEQLLPELVSYIGGESYLSEIKGLIYRNKTEVIVNPPRPYPKNYDLIPFPAWQLFPSVSSLPLLTHRGCPFKCVFCSHNSGSVVRYRSVDNVIQELLYVDAHFSPKHIEIEDETFGLHIERSKKILKKIIEYGLQNRISFNAQSRVDRIDKEFLQLLKMANIQTLQLGVESGSDEVLKRIGKGIHISQVEEAVKWAREVGLRIWCKFILGHPDETIQEMRQTIHLISKLNPDQVSLSIMTPYPGTPIYNMALKNERGYRLLSKKWEAYDKYMGESMELKNVSLAQLKWLQIWAYLRLYITNFRFIALFNVLYTHRIMAMSLIKNLFFQMFKNLFKPLKKNN